MPCRSCLLFISLSSMLERARNDAMPFFSFHPAPSRRLFPRRAGRGADRIRPRFRHGDLPRARFALRLVSHLVGRLVAIVLPSMCFSCVFFIPFSGGMCLLDLSPCPSRSVVSSSRLVMRLGRRRIVMCCLLDLPRWRSLVSSYRLVGRDGERDGATRFRSVDFMVFSCIRNQ